MYYDPWLDFGCIKINYLGTFLNIADVFYMTKYTVLTTVLFANLFILLLVLLRKNKMIMRNFSTYPLLLLAMLCIVRFCVPLEILDTKEIYFRDTYPVIVKFFSQNYLDFGIFELSYFKALIVIWILGITFLLARQMHRSRYFRGWRALLKPVVDQRIYNVMQKVQEASGNTHKVNILMGEEVSVPMMSGFFQPTIYLPEMEFSDDELWHILSHEWNHYVSKDVWVKFGLWLVATIFWWNPLVYLLKHEADHVLEICCDRRATQHYSMEEKKNYLYSILKIVEHNVAVPMPKANNVSVLFDRGNEKFLLERTNTILDTKIHEASVFSQTVIAIMMLAMFLGSYSVVLQPQFDDITPDMGFAVVPGTAFENGDYHEVFPLYEEGYRLWRLEKQFTNHDPFVKLFYECKDDMTYSYLVKIDDDTWNLYDNGKFSTDIGPAMMELESYANLPVYDEVQNNAKIRLTRIINQLNVINCQKNIGKNYQN